jgi:hypothetical protein
LISLESDGAQDDLIGHTPPARQRRLRADQSAIKLLLSLADRYAGSQEPTLQLGELSAEDRAILGEYLKKPVGQDLNPASQADAKEGAEGV